MRKAFNAYEWNILNVNCCAKYIATASFHEMIQNWALIFFLNTEMFAALGFLGGFSIFSPFDIAFILVNLFLTVKSFGFPPSILKSKHIQIRSLCYLMLYFILSSSFRCGFGIVRRKFSPQNIWYGDTLYLPDGSGIKRLKSQLKVINQTWWWLHHSWKTYNLMNKSVRIRKLGVYKSFKIHFTSVKWA